MDPLNYGKLIDKFGDTYIIQVNPKNIATITQFEDYNEIKFYRSGELTYHYIDKLIDNNTFSRTLGTKEWIFRNNEQLLYQVEKATKFITPLTKSETLQNKIITMDIETFIKDGIHIPYVISWYDGENNYSYYLTDFNSSDDMIIKSLKDLMVKSYDNYKIYIHNLSRFDGIFLLKILANLGECQPIIHNDKIISIGFKFKGYDITFRDSKQLLIGSLRSLGKSFNVHSQKGYFPYNFANEHNLNYIGVTPDFTLFDNISLDEYDGITSYNWNLRYEAIKYCEIDCISLYQIVVKFNNMIFEHFNINIHKYPTISSLAFAIFRSSFMESNLIPQLSGQIAKDIRQSYTGGAVDMYIPENTEGSTVYVYDVNALYPSTMVEFDMPVGNPILFEGDIRAIEPDAFGFFYCNIIAPDNLNHPIIQTHIKFGDGLRTVAPLGRWSDMIFSSELDNAVKYGYKFEILWGYKFQRKNIFKDYVDTLYNLRLQYPKSNPLNLIAKLLMNSLYGRFGMIDSFPTIEIIDNNELNDYIDNYIDDNVKFTELGNKTMIIYSQIQKDINTLLDGHKENHNVSIAIAAAITSYARIHMTQFKNNPKFNLYYSDTDSAYFDKPLPIDMVSSKILGKMKLEHVLNDAIFLAPKVYYLETVDGKVIYKVKGLSHNIDLTKNDFEQLLYRENLLPKFQIKWRKNLHDGNISVIDQLYTLKVTDHKINLWSK